MGESFTLILSGTSSILEASYFPPIELNPSKKYALGLIEFLTFNSIPNIDIGTNKFYIGKVELEIPIGSYELDDIEKYILSKLPSDYQLSIKSNNNTLHSEIQSNKIIDFTPSDSIGGILGFSAEKLIPSENIHVSNLPVAILPVNAIRVECNITSGAYVNSNKSHAIFQFFPQVPAGYKVIAIPSHVIYSPIVVDAISNLQLRIVDQDGRLANFRSEIITIRLHVKSI